MKTYSEFIDEARGWNRRSQRSNNTPKPGPKSQQKEKPFGVVLVGLPGSGKTATAIHMASKGSGKSSIARHMATKGSTDQHEFDKSRKELGKSPAYFGPDLATHTFGGAKKSAEQGRNTVLSNTSIPRAHRNDAVQQLKKSGYDDVRVVLSPGSTKAAIRRNRKRTGTEPGSSRVPGFVMNSMKQGMKGTNPSRKGFRSTAGMSRSETRQARDEFKKLHKRFRFTKPAMKRSGAIR